MDIETSRMRETSAKLSGVAELLPETLASAVKTHCSRRSRDAEDTGQLGGVQPVPHREKQDLLVLRVEPGKRISNGRVGSDRAGIRLRLCADRRSDGVGQPFATRRGTTLVGGLLSDGAEQPGALRSRLDRFETPPHGGERLRDDIVEVGCPTTHGVSPDRVVVTSKSLVEAADEVTVWWS